jgi:hypothetical protein
LDLKFVFNSRLLKTQKDDSNLIFSVRKITIAQLKRQLELAYADLSELNQLLLLHTFERRKLLIKYFVLENKSKTEKQNIQVTGKQQLAELIEEISKRDNIIKKLQVDKQASLFRLTQKQNTMSEQIYFDLKNDKVPWNIWKKLKNTPRAQNNEYKFVLDNQVKILAKTNSDLDQRILMFSTIIFLLENEIMLPEKSFQWPALKVLAERKKELQKKKQTDFTFPYDNKFLLMSLAVAFFISLVFVYIRLMVAEIRKRSDFENMKKELIDAIRYSKL